MLQILKYTTLHQQMPEDSATHQAEEQDSLDDALVTWNFLILEAKIIRGWIAWV